MKSKKAEELIEKYAVGNSRDAAPTMMKRRVVECVELAEQDAAERMRENAIEAFCAANCPKGCSFGADGNIGCGAKAIFIQKLNEE
jgi:hypothetical protein